MVLLMLYIKYIKFIGILALFQITFTDSTQIIVEGNQPSSSTTTTTEDVENLEEGEIQDLMSLDLGPNSPNQTQNALLDIIQSLEISTDEQLLEDKSEPSVITIDDEDDKPSPPSPSPPPPPRYPSPLKAPFILQSIPPEVYKKRSYNLYWPRGHVIREFNEFNIPIPLRNRLPPFQTLIPSNRDSFFQFSARNSIGARIDTYGILKEVNEGMIVKRKRQVHQFQPPIPIRPSPPIMQRVPYIPYMQPPPQQRYFNSHFPYQHQAFYKGGYNPAIQRYGQYAYQAFPEPRPFVNPRQPKVPPFNYYHQPEYQRTTNPYNQYYGRIPQSTGSGTARVNPWNYFHQPNNFPRYQSATNFAQPTIPQPIASSTEGVEKAEASVLPSSRKSMPFYSQAELDSHYRRVSNHNETAKDKEFEDDTGLLQWYLQRGKQVLHEKRTRESEARRESPYQHYTNQQYKNLNSINNNIQEVSTRQNPNSAYDIYGGKSTGYIFNGQNIHTNN